MGAIDPSVIISVAAASSIGAVLTTTITLFRERIRSLTKRGRSGAQAVERVTILVDNEAITTEIPKIQLDEETEQQNAEDAGGSRIVDKSGNIIEIRFSDAAIIVRHSMDPSDSTMSFTLEEWKAFLSGARAGAFDLPSSEGRSGVSEDGEDDPGGH